MGLLVSVLLFSPSCSDDSGGDGRGPAVEADVGPDTSEPDPESDATGDPEDADAGDEPGDAGGDDFEETEEDVEAVDQERKTPEQIGVNIPIDDALSAYDAATVRYRTRGSADWQRAHPLIRIRPEWAAQSPEPPNEPQDAFAGTIFDLEPATTYDVEITLKDEDGDSGERVFRRILSTRGLPEPAGEATVTVRPSDDVQETISGLEPGDVLELAEGTYDVDNLQIEVAGTAEEPIYIRGESREGVIIEDDDGRVLQTSGVAHLVLENFTIRGSGTDSGTDASSRGISLSGGADTKFVTVRNLDMEGIDMGVVSSDPLRSTLVYNNHIEGNNGWDDDFVGQKSWNDDGLRLPGRGNCGFENTLIGFGDSFAVHRDVFSAAVHFYRNRVDKSGDDTVEADYSTRNVSFYDNYITNTARVISLDPLWGGPFYGFRNTVINAAAGPHKWNSQGSGFVVYNNTTVRTTGISGSDGWAFVQFANGPLRNFSYRNNVVIYRGSSDDTLAFEPDGVDPVDWTHNAWHPDGRSVWTNTGGWFDSVEKAHEQLPETAPMFGASTKRHDNYAIASSSPFPSETDPELGDDYLTAVEHSKPLVPGDDSKLRNSGTPIPNITDGYDGSAPDRGAVIRGRSTPQWGADR